jgi:GNAT superfamily N-acetyltransferase
MPDDVRIRLAVDEDAEAIAGFNVAMALETEGKELSPEVVGGGVRGLFENPKYGFYVVAERAGEVVGALMITYEWSDWRCGVFWWIQSVYIRPDSRRKGVFTMLYEFLRAKARQDGRVCGLRLYLERSNETAEATYRNLGMTRSSYHIFEEEFDS